jgi:hypothetical protein
MLELTTSEETLGGLPKKPLTRVYSIRVIVGTGS